MLIGIAFVVEDPSKGQCVLLRFPPTGNLDQDELVHHRKETEKGISLSSPKSGHAGTPSLNISTPNQRSKNPDELKVSPGQSKPLTFKGEKTFSKSEDHNLKDQILIDNAKDDTFNHDISSRWELDVNRKETFNSNDKTGDIRGNGLNVQDEHYSVKSSGEEKLDSSPDTGEKSNARENHFSTARTSEDKEGIGARQDGLFPKKNDEIEPKPHSSNKVARSNFDTTFHSNTDTFRLTKIQIDQKFSPRKKNGKWSAISRGSCRHLNSSRRARTAQK